MLPRDKRSVRCAVLSIADTRTPETDDSGRMIKTRLVEEGHVIADYRIIPDDPNQIRQQLVRIAEIPQIQAVICNGGTGITPHDQSFEAILAMLEKKVDGFGEIFRYLAFKEMGAAAILMRAAAGIYRNQVIISLPGAPSCVHLALEKILLPELGQMVSLARKNSEHHRSGVH